MSILGKNFETKKNIQKWIFLFFSKKITISPRYMRHLSPSRDVCLRLMAKYLHIHIPTQN